MYDVHNPRTRITLAIKPENVPYIRVFMDGQTFPLGNFAWCTTQLLQSRQRSGGFTLEVREVSPFASRMQDSKWLRNSHACHPGNETRQGDMIKVTSWNTPNKSQVLVFLFYFCCSPTQSTLNVKLLMQPPHLSQMCTSKRLRKSSKIVILFGEMKQKEGLNST